MNRDEARFEQDMNRANTIGTVWLGLTVGCAQCHNHKYDPISQREFYQLFAYVANLEEDDIDAPMPGEIGPYLKARPEYDKQRRTMLREYDVSPWQAKYEERAEAGGRESRREPGVGLPGHGVQGAYG